MSEQMNEQMKNEFINESIAKKRMKVEANILGRKEGTEKETTERADI